MFVSMRASAFAVIVGGGGVCMCVYVYVCVCVVCARALARVCVYLGLHLMHIVSRSAFIATVLW